MIVAGVTALVALVACVSDLATRRIPNALTFAACVGGLLFHAGTGGTERLLWSVGGMGVAAGLYFPFFALGGLGAGDVKLLGCLGAWLGPASALWLALYTALAGGVAAIVLALARGYLGTALTNLWVLVGFWRVAGIRPMQGLTLASSGSPRLPYALPITTGLLLTLWLR